MSTDKTKLTPESKRTLLEQSFQWLKLSKDSNKNVPAFFSFAKFILINQSFSNISRNTSFDIYELYMNYYRGWGRESDYLYFKSKHVGLKGIEMSFERDYKLVKLFQPPKICLNFSNKIEKKVLNELIEILEVTNGEISMRVTCTIDPFYVVVRDFSSRIRNFSCNGKFFTFCGMSSFGFLDKLEVHDFIQNAGQCLHISQCKAKFLDLSLVACEFKDPHSFELPMPRNNEDFLNKTVKRLNLGLYEFDYSMTQRIIEQILQFFPLLVELKINAIVSYDEHPKSQIPNVAFNSHQYIYALKDRLFANGLQKIALKFNNRLYYEGKCNSKWIKKTINKVEFSDWKCKLKYRWPSNHYDHDHRDVVLKFSIEEGINCKFGIKLEISHDTGTSEDDDGDLMEHDGN